MLLCKMAICLYHICTPSFVHHPVQARSHSVLTPFAVQCWCRAHSSFFLFRPLSGRSGPSRGSGGSVDTSAVGEVGCAESPSREWVAGGTHQVGPGTRSGGEGAHSLPRPQWCVCDVMCVTVVWCGVVWCGMVWCVWCDVRLWCVV